MDCRQDQHGESRCHVNHHKQLHNENDTESSADMAKTIAINGTNLHEVCMLLEPNGNGSISYSSYPTSQFRVTGNQNTLRLVIPAYLALELYRIGKLPQDASLPVEIAIDGRSVGWFTVSDMRHPHHSDGPFPQVNFTLVRVRQTHTRDASDMPPESRSAPAEKGAYVTDITHYLDETGELLTLPGPARKLASFLTLVIEAATGIASTDEHDSGIRCRAKGCRGTIRTGLPPTRGEILWICSVCGHHGVIRNWQNTKWNERKGTEKPE